MKMCFFFVKIKEEIGISMMTAKKSNLFCDSLGKKAHKLEVSKENSAHFQKYF
jgi:hypothetical protein